ncbi:MAG: L,D-transpeptidase family protein [Candidatus Binatia bacterium]
MQATLASAVLALLSVGVAGAAAIEPPPAYQQVTGQQVVHAVTPGETLGQIAHRFGMRTELAATINHLADRNRLRLGQPLILSNRHIVPAAQLRDGLVINLGDLTLYWLRDGAVVESFPVGVGRAAWQTPAGHYSIVSRRRDPIWHVPPSIQKEMQEKREAVKKKVPPGPDNPLGKYWLQLSAPGYGIHGTNAPASVGKYTTHGCIRLRPDDIERLYHEVPNGTAVDVINEPIKLARLDSGAILLEAHAGLAAHAERSAAAFLEAIAQSSVADLVDMGKARRVVGDAWGIAIDVSKEGTESGTPSPSE